ncbi:hypothetical protein N7470_000776 [Penicillium chermesinum]|nr:hypothetical protein N7470_000776 [Penicillium chermesinum]
MKLIVAGATGLVVELHDEDPTFKLKSVVVRDYGEYPDHVRAEFEGADACIWYLTIILPQSSIERLDKPRRILMSLSFRIVVVILFRTGNFDFAEVKRVCQDCTLAGFKAIYDSRRTKPFHFLYFSADGTPRDPAKKPAVLGDYQVMRCETELMVLKFPEEYPNIDICIAQPGVIVNSTTLSRAMVAAVFRVINTFTRAIPNIHREELSAAVLDLIVTGFDKDRVGNSELVDRGQKALKTTKGRSQT